MSNGDWDNSNSIGFRPVGLNLDDGHRQFNSGWNALLELILREHPAMAAQWGGQVARALEAA